MQKDFPFQASNEYQTLEDSILEANSYGLPFDEVMNFTLGELVKYINYHRDEHRRHLQEQSIIAYRQALLTAGAFAEGSNVGEVFDVFPFWTDDEILDINASRALKYFEQF